MAHTVIVKEAEETLLETIAVCRKVNLPLRAIHIECAKIADKPKDWCARTLKAVGEAMEDTDAIAYVCEDDDLFILSRVATHKTVLRVLGSLPKDLVPDPAPGLAHLFEVHIEGQILTEIVQEKILEKQRRAAQVAEESRAALTAARATMERHLEEDIAVNAAQIASLPARRAARKKPAILMIEDDVFSLHLVAHALRDEAEVHLASNARQGLLAYLKTAPDIVFLDINMPGLSGLDILREFFSVDPAAYIVMLSGNGNRDNVMDAMTGGAKGFISKPFTLDKIKDYMARCPHIQNKRLTQKEIDYAR